MLSPQCSKPVPCSTQPDTAHESFWISKLLHSPLLLPINNLPFTPYCRKQNLCSFATGQKQKKQSEQRWTFIYCTIHSDWSITEATLVLHHRHNTNSHGQRRSRSKNNVNLIKPTVNTLNLHTLISYFQLLILIRMK